MQIKNISNAELENKLLELVKKERKITHEILLHIQEVDRRSLHLALGYSSLTKYLIEKYHYSEGSAVRRINAMRMLKTNPEVKEKIIEGKLNLTQLSMVQTAIYKKQKGEKVQVSKQVKTELLLELENKTIASTESIVATKLNIDLKEKKQITHGKEEVTYLNFKYEKEDFETLKDCLQLMSHQAKDYQDLFLVLARKLIKAKTTLKQNTRQSPLGMPCKKKDLQDQIKPMQKESIPPAVEGIPTSSNQIQKNMTQSNLTVKFRNRSYIGKQIELCYKQSRYIATSVKKQVFIRDKFQCQFKAESGHICGSKMFLQPHHIIPFARDGQNALDNLSLRCRAHNLYEAEIVGLGRQES
ncbi:MAG: HNH endonuclease [Pseudobdellovibrionaceae bacterium]